MQFISITRLRLRALRFLPQFLVLTLRAQRQVQAAEGFKGGALLADRRWTFWTLTAWGSEADMRAYMTTGDHRQAMPKLMDWCDEASVVHWTEPGDALPSWLSADERMRREGRPSKINRPGVHHASMTFPSPRTAAAAPITPRRRA